MQSLEEIMNQAQAREQRQAEDDLHWQRKHTSFLKRSAIGGGIVGLGHGGILLFLFETPIFVVSQIIAAAIAFYCSAKFLPGMFRGMFLLLVAEFIGFYVAILISGIDMTADSGFAGNIGFFMMLLFTIASWPPIGGFMGMYTENWYNDHYQKRLRV
jgi:ABC-type multidrug transport system permease subunit